MAHGSALLRSGERSGMVLAGAPGVGRTRIANAILEEAKAQSYVVMRVTATESAAGLPFGAFGSLLPPLAAESLGGARTSAALSQVQHHVAGKAPGGRLALVVDDAHLLDDESAILVHQLATTGTAFIIATMRSGVVAPDPLVALWKDETLDRLDLRPLSPPIVDALLTAVLGGSVDGATRRYLWARTRGNIQLLRELVRSALECDALRDEGGVWRLVGSLPPSTRLLELVEATLQFLPPEERAVFETVACGEPLGIAVLAELVDRRHLEALERRGLLTVTGEGRRRMVSTTHPVHGDVVRHHMPVVRSDTVRRALAAAFERSGMRRREDVLRVAGWRLEGGGQIPVDLALSAADRAVDAGDLDLAVRLAGAAVDADGGFEAALLAAWLTGLNGQGELSEELLAGLVGVAVTDAERSLLAVSQADNLVRLSRPDEAFTVLRAAEGSIASPECRDELASKRAYVLLCTRRPAEALAAADEIMGRATGRALSEACFVRAVAHAQAGRVVPALQASATGEQAGAVPGQPVFWPRWVHALTRIDTLLWAGALHEAESEARRSYATTVAEGRRAAQAAFACSMGRIALAQGRATTATCLGREGLTLLQSQPRWRIVRQALASTAWSLALTGATDEAEMLIAEYDAMDGSTVVPFTADIDHARAWVAATSGDAGMARDVLWKTAGRAQEGGEIAVEARALHDLARLGEAEAVASRLAALARGIESALTAAQSQHVLSLAEDDGVGLDAASLAFETMGALLLAAEAAGSAARAWRRAGEVRSAKASERRAALLASRCEGAITPGLADVTRCMTLTAREREVAGLAAGGLSNREITQRLFLSVRTVENQLQRAYKKLGVRSRSELAGAMDAR